MLIIKILEQRLKHIIIINDTEMFKRKKIDVDYKN